MTNQQIESREQQGERRLWYEASVAEVVLLVLLLLMLGSVLKLQHHEKIPKLVPASKGFNRVNRAAMMMFLQGYGCLRNTAAK
jgi:hypothetical protein